MSLSDHAARDPLLATTEERLAAWRRAGDDAAFTALIAPHATMIRATCARLLGRRHPAVDDAAQAVALVLRRKAAGLRGDRLGCWLHAVARTVCMRVSREDLRRRRREARAAAAYPRVAEPASDNDTDEGERLRAELDVALARLSPAQREAVIGRYLEVGPSATWPARSELARAR